MPHLPGFSTPRVDPERAPPPNPFQPKPVERSTPPQRPDPVTPAPQGSPQPSFAPGTSGLIPVLGTPEAFTREFRQRIDQHLTTHREQVGRAHQLQFAIRDVVERFVSLVNQDDQLRQVFRSDDLSDEQRDDLKAKTVVVEKELGVAWGSDPEKTPQGEANLNARVLASGMMI